MPVYEYQCTACGEIFEVLHKIDEEYNEGCPKCRGKAKKILSPTNFVLKGPGFYVNDYPSDSRKKAASTEHKPEKPSPPKEDKKTKETTAAKS
jgi:putative FmdB family regulatory protein